jgi:hypothetical protein
MILSSLIPMSALSYNDEMKTDTRQQKIKAITFRLGADLVAAMERLHERDGIDNSEMVRRALAVFLEDKGVMKPGRRKGAA